MDSEKTESSNSKDGSDATPPEGTLATLLQNRRLSLAYGALDHVPRPILKYVAKQIEILDLSHNRFANLFFLHQFSSLKTLILDKNVHLDVSTLPTLSNLEVLWLNNCNLININEWLEQLRNKCPALKNLSMMCNPVGQTVLNGVSEHDENAYRIQVVKSLPQLEYFDGIKITDKEKKWAERSKKSQLLIEEIFQRKMGSVLGVAMRCNLSYKSLDRCNAV